MICVVCGLAPSADAQRWDVETQDPGGRMFVFSSASIGADDIIGVGTNGGIAGQARVFRMLNGTVRWSKNLVNNVQPWGVNRYEEVCITSNGDVVTVGSGSGLGYFGLITRLDTSGNLLWTTTVNVSGEATSFNSVIEAPDGSLYAVGRAGMVAHSSSCVAKFTATGDLVWMRDYSISGEHNFVSAQMHSDTLLALERPIWAPGVSGLALSKFAPDGTLVARRAYDTGNVDKASGLVPDGSGGYVICFERFNGMIGLLHVDQRLEPIGQTILVSDLNALGAEGGGVFNDSMNEFTLLGRATNGTEGFAAALCVSFNTNSIVWHRTFPETESFTSSCSAGLPNSLLASCYTNTYNGNGSLPAHIFRMDLFTGENTIGPACDFSEPIFPSISQEPITFTDQFPTQRNLVPAIFQDFSFQDFPLLITPCTPILLPVVWLNWQAEAVPAGIQLTWSTASETNNDRYIVERSTDPNEWVNIGEVPVSANTIGRTNYVWKDEFPNVGSNYYRLRQVDQDGSSNLTSVQAIQWSGSEQGPLFYPNPVAPDQAVRAQEMVVVMDLLGKQVKGPSLEFQAPQQPGLYLVRGKTRVEQLVVR